MLWGERDQVMWPPACPMPALAPTSVMSPGPEPSSSSASRSFLPPRFQALSSSPKDPSSSRSAPMEPAFPSKDRAGRPASPVQARVAHCHLVGAPSLASPSATLWSSHHPTQSWQPFLETSLKLGPLPFHPLLPTIRAGPLGHIHLGQPRLSLPIASQPSFIKCFPDPATPPIP